MCSLPCSNSGFLNGPERLSLAIEGSMLRNVSANTSWQKWVDVEVREFQRRAARHIAFKIDIAVKCERSPWGISSARSG